MEWSDLNSVQHGLDMYNVVWLSTVKYNHKILAVLICVVLDKISCSPNIVTITNKKIKI